jgi:putative holliday junction resolvase
MTQAVRALGLDVGKKRIGVAGCDGLGLVAAGITTVHRTSFDAVVAEIKHIVQARQVEVLVIGLPYTMAGDLGTQARQTQKFAQRLSVALGLPVEFVDERLTSYEAEQLMLESGLSPSQHKAVVDRKAACLILQQWLAQRSP